MVGMRGQPCILLPIVWLYAAYDAYTIGKKMEGETS